MTDLESHEIEKHRLSFHLPSAAASDEGDDDSLAVHRPARNPLSNIAQSGAVDLSPSVLYSVVHSPLYQVPILYFSFHGLPETSHPSLSTLATRRKT